MWTLRSGWVVLGVGEADVDLVAGGQDLPEAKAGEPGLAAQQVAKHLPPEPLAPLDRAGEVLVGLIPDQAREVGRDLLDGHVTAVTFDPEVQCQDEPERHQQADGARQGDPPPPPGREEGDHDRQRGQRGHEPAAGLRADGQQGHQPEDRHQGVPALARPGAHHPVNPKPQEAKAQPDVHSHVGVAERVDRRGRAGT